MEPRLTRAGYEKGYTAALLAAACPLGLLIPPSSAQVLYAWSSGTSVLACFTATIVPGLILVALLCLVNMVMTQKFDIVQPPKEHFRTWGRNTARSTLRAIPALIMPVIIGRNLWRYHDGYRSRRHQRGLCHPLRHVHL